MKPYEEDDAFELRFEVSYLDPQDGERKVYGRASDRDGAHTLVASVKAQERGLRDVRIRDRWERTAPRPIFFNHHQES